MAEKFVIRVRETPNSAVDLIVEAADTEHASRFVETVCDTTRVSGTPSAYERYVRPFMEEDPDAEEGPTDDCDGLGRVDWDDPQPADFFGLGDLAPHFDLQEVYAFAD